MHICIVGTGASGWIAANYLKTYDCVKKVTVIGSSKVPSIGVGESNTLAFMHFLTYLIELGEISFEDFIRETDAAVKYGVYYKNWSKRDFIHHFKSDSSWRSAFDRRHYGRLLANKNPETHIHDFFGKDLFYSSKKNLVSLEYSHNLTSFHFDASKFINFFSKIALKSPKVSHHDLHIVGGEKKNDKVNYIVSECGKKIEADYFIFATGDAKINEEFLGVKYQSLQKYLLTDTAIVYPLMYKNKRKEFHPYTVAKTMKNGWRWITPTWSRIGTGYVFSSNHVSEDEAIDEFLKDIGDDAIKPNTVKFNPRYNPKPFHNNWCTLGMSQGFLEPLDAPGLTITMETLFHQLGYYILNYDSIFKKDLDIMNVEIDKLNDFVVRKKFHFWCAFILCQYKTCHRDDTKFWIDHKNVECEFYNEIISNLDIYNDSLENFLFQQTIAAKDITWKTSLSSEPYVVADVDCDKIHHLDYISQFH